MEKTISLVEQLQKNNPNIGFEPGDTFGWNPKTNVVTYDETSDNLGPYLLHEYGHATLSHSGYDRDIRLIAMEREAWKKAREIAPTYNVTIPADVVESSLDTYRDWMHARSVCPMCGATGIQTADQLYTCVACLAGWKVNEARQCALRRYIRSPTQKLPE